MKVAATQLPRASSASKKSQKDSSASLCPETKIAVSCRLSVQKPSQNASNRSNAFKFDNFGAETPSNRTTVSSRSSTRAPITHNYTLQKNTGLFVEGRPKVESVYTTHPEYSMITYHFPSKILFNLEPTSRKSAVTVSTERGCAKANDVQTQSDLDYSEDSNRHSVRSKLKSIGNSSLTSILFWTPKQQKQEILSIVEVLSAFKGLEIRNWMNQIRGTWATATMLKWLSRQWIRKNQKGKPCHLMEIWVLIRSLGLTSRHKLSGKKKRIKEEKMRLKQISKRSAKGPYLIISSPRTNLKARRRTTKSAIKWTQFWKV